MFRSALLSFFILGLALAELDAAPTQTDIEDCSIDYADLGRSGRTEVVAREVGLKVTTDQTPGYTREISRYVRKADGTRTPIFIYRDPKGNVLSAKERDDLLARLKQLKIVIPPAWENVWINRDNRGHQMVTGFSKDAKGEPRKQHLYHPLFKNARAARKFNHNAAFGKKLSTMREKAFQDLDQKQLTREKVLAAAVLLLDTTLIRPGSEDSALGMGNYGLTTLQKRHIKLVQPGEIELKFRGKKGVQQDLVAYHYEDLTKTLNQLRNSPGDDFFRYQDESGRWKTITANELNTYINQTMGNGFTAKNFRTWGATALAVEILSGYPPPKDEREAKKNWNETRELVSTALGNRPAEAENSYIDPLVKHAYFNDPESFPNIGHPRGRAGEETRGLTRIERSVLQFVEGLRNAEGEEQK